VREKTVLAPGLALLVLGLACTVGETPPAPPGPAPEPTPVETPDTAGEAPASPEAAGAPAEEEETPEEAYRATDLLIQAQLAYEAVRLEESLSMAERVLADYPQSMAVEPARWVGARASFALGRYAQAAAMGETYAAGQPSGSTLAERARELVRLAEDAQAVPAAAPAVIGAILPRSGPRVLVRYGDWVLEGIELAVEEAERRQGRPIELVVVDDSGGARTREAVRELEARNALAIVGPLLPQQLAVAAEARRNPRRVIVSPTAPPSSLWPRTYSVRTGDTRGAQRLGRYAADVGFRQAAVLFARGREYERKAQAFAVEYETLGGDVKARVPYDSGTTTFGPHMNRILDAVAPEDTVVTGPLVDSLIALGLLPNRVVADTMPRDTLLMLVDLVRPDSLRERVWTPVDSLMPPPYDTADPWLGLPPQQPFALFVAGPQQDVPKIAPQVAFYDLDSAGVQVFGDEAWADASTRRVVPRRDLEGVIAASLFPPGRGAEVADSTFVAAYEARYRRSLNNALPALGYDAANLVLQALPNRWLEPEAVAQRFGFLAGIRGATGVFSVRGGQVVRTPHLVVIRRGALEPAPYPWEYVMPEPLPPTPPDTTEEAEEEEGGSG
jgi:ABC-type branched-subunit amino acid transport system substrate-binding protein